MHIGVFSDGINIPPKEGINVHTYELVLSLAKNPDHNVTLFVADRGWLSHTAIEQQPFETILLPKEMFYDIQKVRELIRDFGITIAQSYSCYYSSVVLGPACLESHIPMVLELHDLEKAVIPLYYQGDELPGAMREHIAFQQQASDYASAIRVMSKFDFDDLVSEPDANTHKLNWLPVALGEPSRPRDNTDGEKAIYIGNMSYAPNTEGATIIKEQIAPLDQIIHYSFVGRGSEVFDGGNIVSAGMVDTLEPYVAEASIGLAPIISGSGMKIKSMTYLKYGLPVLTTKFAAHGYPVSEAIIIEDDFARWPVIIRKLLADPEEKARLSQIATAYFYEHFSATTISHKLFEIYQHAIDTYDVTQIISHEIQPVDLSNLYWLREAREENLSTVSDIVRFPGVKS